MAGGWALFGDTESLIAGLIFGMLLGRVLVAGRHGW
jgi:hypothetical protein